MPNLQPIYLELDKKREVAYTVGSAITLRENEYAARVMVEELEPNSSGRRFKIHHDVVVAWLVACLQREARRTGEALDDAWAADQLDSEDKLIAAVEAINAAVTRYHGKELGSSGEASRPSRARRRAANATR